MKKSLFLLLCIVFAQFSSVLVVFVQRAYPVSAQETPHWFLVETRINPSNIPLQSTRDLRMTIRGIKTGWVEYTSSTVSDTVMTLQVRRATLDGEVERKEDYKHVYNFTFEKPPVRLYPGETILLKASGTASPVGASYHEFYYGHWSAVDASKDEKSGNLKLTLGGEKTSGSITTTHTVPPLSYIRRQFEIQAYGPGAGLQVEWVYEKRGLPSPTPTARPSPTPARAVTTPSPVSQPTGIPSQAIELAETPQERQERAIAQNLVDYLRLRKGIERDLQAFYRRADGILYDMREAEWMLANGTPEDKKQAAADIERLKKDMAQLMVDFEARVKPLTDVLKSMEGLFGDYRQRKEYLDTLKAYGSEINLVRINIALRSGNKAKFDELFPLYRTDASIAVHVLTANAFRRLMDGDMRTALESVRLALAQDSRNPTALQLMQEIEVAYLARIRGQLASEMAENARLFNEKLDGHGEKGMGQFLLDVLTTGVGQSAQAIAGYYDLVESTASLNIDEAARQIAGIQLVEDLRRRGVTFEEIQGLSIERMRELALEQYNRTMTAEDARKLRDRLWAAFGNVDVNAIRRGEKTQFNVDIGKEFFDTTILKQDIADVAAKRFSAWETFLTFAPSAQLGRIAQTSLAGKLGLTAESTLQQGLASGLRIQTLGHRIYQTRLGAATIDGLYQWNAFKTMVSEAIKNRIGEVAFAAGRAAGGVSVNAAIDAAMSSEKGKKLKEDIVKVSDYYLGEGNTEMVGNALSTLGDIFEFVGLNSDELTRGAYGRGDFSKAQESIKQELAKESTAVANSGVTRAAARPRSFQEFETQVKTQGGAYQQSLGQARGRLSNLDTGKGVGRKNLRQQADQTLRQMQEAADAVSSGDRARAQTLWNQMQNSSGRNLDINYSQRTRQLGSLRDQAKVLEQLASASPEDSEFVEQVLGVLSGDEQEYQAGTSEFLAALQAAGLKGVVLK